MLLEFKSGVIFLISVICIPLLGLSQINKDCIRLNEYLDEVLVNAKFNNLESHPEIFTKINKSLEYECDFSGKAITIKGVLHYTAGDILSAKESYFKAEKLLSDQNKINTADYALNQLNLGIIYVLELNNENALTCFNRCLNISESLGNKFETADANLNIGLVKLEMGEYEESEAYLRKSIEILNTIDVLPTHGYANYNLARLYQKQEDYQKATDYNEEARSIWESIGDKKGLYFYARLQSNIYAATGDIDQEILLLEEALEYTGGQGIKYANTNFLLGQAYLKNNEIASAEKYLRVSVKNAMLFDHEDMEMAVDELKNLYTRRADYKAMSDLLDDLVQSFKVNKDIAKLTEIKLLEKDVSVDTLNKLNLSLTTANNEIERRSKVRVYLFSIAGILAFLVFTYISKLNGDKGRLISKVKENNLQLQTSNEELEQYSKTINMQNKMLSSKNEDLQNFAFTASHDIKSPLKTIMSYADLLPTLVDRGEDDKVKVFATTIKHSCKRLSDLVTDLLEYAKIDQKKLNITEIKTKDFFNDLIASLKSELESKKATIEIDQSIPATIKGDKIKLTQLFQNLFSNSIKFSKKGIAPSIKVIGLKEDKEYQVLKVADNGIGIPEKHLVKIFSMFEKLHSDAEYAGTGIGLAVCQKVALMHNGLLEVDSEEGVGTSFTLRLPK